MWAVFCSCQLFAYLVLPCRFVYICRKGEKIIISRFSFSGLFLEIIWLLFGFILFGIWPLICHKKNRIDVIKLWFVFCLCLYHTVCFFVAVQINFGVSPRDTNYLMSSFQSAFYLKLGFYYLIFFGRLAANLPHWRFCQFFLMFGLVFSI